MIHGPGGDLVPVKAFLRELGVPFRVIPLRMTLKKGADIGDEYY